MNTTITPAQALFAVYQLSIPNGDTTVYEVPTLVREAPATEDLNGGTVYRFRSVDPRVPVEDILIVLHEGVPTVGEIDLL